MIQRLIITLATLAATLAAAAQGGTSSSATGWTFTQLGASNVYTRSGTDPNYTYTAVTGPQNGQPGAAFDPAANYYKKGTPTYISFGQEPYTGHQDILNIEHTWNATAAAQLFSYQEGATTDGVMEIANVNHVNQGNYADLNTWNHYCMECAEGVTGSLAVTTTTTDGDGNTVTAKKYYTPVAGDDLNTYVSNTYKLKYDADVKLYTQEADGTYRVAIDNSWTAIDANTTYYIPQYPYEPYAADLPSDGSETLTQHFDHLGYIVTDKIYTITDLSTFRATDVPAGTMGLRVETDLADATKSTLTEAAVEELKKVTGLEHIIMNGCSDPSKLAIDMFSDDDFGSRTSVTEIVLPPDYAQAAIDKTKFPAASLPALACVTSADCKRTTVNDDGTVTQTTESKAQHLSAYVIRPGSFFSSNATKAHLPQIWENDKLVAKNIIAVGDINISDIHAIDANTHTPSATDMIGSQVETLDLSGATYHPQPGEDTGLAFKIDDGNNKGHLRRLLLPDGIEAIQDGAYSGCTSLEYVSLPASVRTIGDMAFLECKKLTAVDVAHGSEMTDLGDKAFKGCNLQQIRLPNKLRTIGNECFMAHGNVNNEFPVVMFPASLQSIGGQAFENAWVKDFYFLGTTPVSVGSNAFTNGQWYGSGGMSQQGVRVMKPDGTFLLNSDGTYADPSALAGLVTGWQNLGQSFALDQQAVAAAEAAGYKLIGSHDLYKQRLNDDSYTAVLHLNPELTQDRSKLLYFTDPDRSYSLTDWRTGEGRRWPTRMEMTNAFNKAGEGKLGDGTPLASQYIPYEPLHKFALVCFDAQFPSTEDVDISKFKEGFWWSFCVPFNMTKKQVVEVFGSETRVCKLSEITRELDDATNVMNLEIRFCDEQCLYDRNGDRWEAQPDDIVIHANFPYMIHPQTGSVKPDGWVFGKFEDYELSEQISPISHTLTTTCQHEGSPHSRTYNYYGNYADKSNHKNAAGIFPDVYFPQFSYFMYYHNVGGGDKEYHELSVCPWADLKHTPYSCCLTILEDKYRADDYREIFGRNADGTLVSGGGSVRRRFAGAIGAKGDGDAHSQATTAVEHVRIVCGKDSPEAISDYYTLDGRRLPARPARPGIYIHGGRKEAVR